jgi:hypothetical protein
MNAVDLYIEDLPEHHKEIARQVREMIFECVPNVHEKFSFKLPFYHYYGMFCYINKLPKGIDFCLCRGRDLLDEFPQLQIKSRVQIAGVELFSVNDIKLKQIKQVIITAAQSNEEAKKNGKPYFKKAK